MRNNIPTIPQLRSFVKVADTGTFVRAARDMNISQPSLTRHIKALEELLGIRLFDRDTRKVTLSTAGRQMLSICRRMLSEAEHSTKALAQVASGSRGQITIAALPSVASAILPEVVPDFLGQNDGVEIRIIDATLRGAETSVLHGRADFGLTARPDQNRELSYRHLFNDPMIAIIRNDDPLAVRKSITWKELGARPFISTEERTSIRLLVSQGFAEAGVIDSPAFEVTTAMTATTLAAAGLGVTAIPMLNTVEINHSVLVWKPLIKPQINREIGIVTAIGRSLSPSTQQMIAAIRKVVTKREFTNRWR